MANQSAYPVSVEGELSEDLSRWLWIFKLILIIPHVVVLFFLWIAFIAITVVAFSPSCSRADIPAACSDLTWA